MNFSNRQIEIIKAATVLIGNKGIQNLTTKNLAAEMGFSEPALYRHFKNKTDILQSVLMFYREQMKAGIGELLTNNESGADKIKALILYSAFSEAYARPR